jgi:mannosyltransferase OCH1-like enzyme
MISKIIHQTAPSKSLTTEEQRVLRLNKRLLPGWDFRFYDDTDNERVMAETFPEFAEAFRGIRRGVVQADIIRCVYLYQYGGWYLDTDYRLLRPLEGMVINSEYCSGRRSGAEVDLMEQSLILPVSGTPGRDQHLVCNSILASEKGHLFWAAFIESLFSDSNLAFLDEHAVEGLTGPLGLSRFFLANREKFPEICLPLKRYFHPKITTWGFSYEKHSETYGVHWCWGSWRSKGALRKVKNYLTRKITSFRH